MTLTPLPLYVYVLVRADLSLEQQLVQACHASWHAGQEAAAPQDIPNLVALSVPNESALLQAAQTLEVQGVAHSLFHEPDDNTGHTALASRPVWEEHHRKLFAKYRLIRWGPSPR